MRVKRGLLLDYKNQVTFYLVIIFLVVIILLIQGSFLTFFLDGGMIPDLLLIFVVCLAFLWEERRGVVIGLVAGFIQDIMFGPALGFFALSKMTVAFLAGTTSREIYKDQVIGPMITVFMATFVHEMMVYFLTALYWGVQFPFVLAVERLFLPQAVYHLLLTLFIYPLIYRAEQRKIFYPF